MPLQRLHSVQLEQLVRWTNEGFSQEEVARRLNVSQSVVSRAWTRYLATGTPAYGHEGGRERAITRAQDRFIVLTARQNPTFTASRINSRFRQASGRTIFSQTIRRRLHAAHLRARRRATHPRLTAEQRASRYRDGSNHTFTLFGGESVRVGRHLSVCNIIIRVQQFEQAPWVLDFDFGSTLQKSFPVYKWNVKFDGRVSSVFAFLETVDELCHSRNVSKEELFISAVELFSGPTLTWFRSISENVKDWNSLVTLLKGHYLPHDYDDRLWNEIKMRTQGKNELVHEYIAIMKSLDDCLEFHMNPRF
ncbi:hypothetical protein TcasGA2_TC012951 [Tribolium castaneum]|uniref:Retrotransposon gag domain-containing protein n=1 Tax=Tribolium castaneum TaxID=7070 RepID=D6X3E5_TRICA|nr:hypothetical protein TcasGA2_TC012951 [Tribolium castaneum]